MMDNQWRKVLIGPTSSIHNAIEVIDKESLRVALVVDAQEKLLGVITDGDVRRGLLSQIQLTEPVSRIMNAEPKSVSVAESRESWLEIMEVEGLLHLPVLDDGVIVGMETLQNLLKCPKFDNPVFLMAGGFGTRLKPLTDNCPKPLLLVGNKPILETILEQFIAAGFHRFYVSTHYMPEMIRRHFGDGSKWGVSITYIHEDMPLGTGGALGLLPNDLPDLPLIIMNGDILTKVDFVNLLKFHQETNAVSTMCVREYDYQVPYGVVEAQGYRVTSMKEKPTYSFFVNAGIYVVNTKVIKGVQKNVKVDMPTLLERTINNGELVSMFPIHEYWLDIGQMPDFEKAQKDFAQDFA
ncbi:MAG: nucleotidyltransferase family protein [Cycloclasticus sp.]|jgi:Nucleoside-diphosphate-sugar pyrophosphorylase involved in lipopolysaccharide biosynthesis/translation initiation factor 2B, gamma/epsilon subunits (eIF-2Bgamma/eIF-2Bepsilon)